MMRVIDGAIAKPFAKVLLVDKERTSAIPTQAGLAEV